MLMVADTTVLGAKKDERCPPKGGRYIELDRTGKSACEARDDGAFMVGAKHAARSNTLRSPAEKIIGGPT